MKVSGGEWSRRHASASFIDPPVSESLRAAAQKRAPLGRPAKAAESRPRRAKTARFNSGGVRKLAGLGADADLDSDSGPDLPGREAPPSAPDLFMLLGLCRNAAEL